MTTDYGAQAQSYAAVGMRMLPLKAKTKDSPLLRDWPSRAAADPGKVAGWWQRHPSANVAVVMGAGSQLADLETDVKGNTTGEDSLKEWAACPSGCELPKTWAFMSGGGGLHRLFRCDNAAIGNRVGVLPAVDFRGTGGYAVFPPSLHPNGKRYKWLPGCSPDDLPDGPADLPFELYCLIMESGADYGQPLEVPEEIPEGGRNNMMFKWACKLRRGGLSGEGLLAALRVENEQRCTPPLDDDELELICKQAAKYEAGELPKETAQGLADPGKLKTVCLADMTPKRAEYLWFPYIPRGKLTIMAGVSGSTKTWLSCDLTARVSNGVNFFTDDALTKTRRPGKVIYLTKENDFESDLLDRFGKLGANLNNIFTIDDRNTDEQGFPLSLTDGRIEQAAEAYQPELFIFDPIQSYVGADIDFHRANEVRPILDKLIDLAKRFNCAVVLVAHMSKMTTASALDRILGSSDFRNAARSILIVGSDPEDKESRVLAHGKNSLGRIGSSIRYHIDDTAGVVFDGLCDLDEDTIVQPKRDGTRNKPSVALGEATTFLYDLLGVKGYAALEDIKTAAEEQGVKKQTLYNARDAARLQAVTIGFGADKQTWWLETSLDVEQFRQERQTELDFADIL